jgi:hypothetical protein
MSDTTTAATQEDRDAAARYFLDDDEVESETYDERLYGLAGDWLILTDDEANEAACDNIRESAWAFIPGFLVSYLPKGVGEEIIEALQPQCEGANEAILSMLGDRFDEFADDAMSSDGRGHFLSGWDGVEHEFQHNGRDWYAYRT